MQQGRGGSDKEKMGLIGILTGLIIMAVILVVGITIVRNGNSDEQVGESENVQPVWYLEGIDEINDGVALEDGILFFQQRIDEASDEEKVDLYERRMLYVADNSDFGEYADLLINDAIAIDNIEQSIDSAAQVVNEASSYGRQDLEEKYNQILKERMNANGLETEGLEGIG